MAQPKPKPFAIYPAVGIARLGTSPELTSFIGPDFPDPNFTPFPIPFFSGRFRDPAGNIRRQGVRFRVYRVKWRRYRDGWVPRAAKEVTASDGFTFKWTVDVANFKAFTSAQSPESKESPARVPNKARAEISGRNRPSQRLEGNAQNLLLGTISTDDQGRLVFFAGIGECRNVGSTSPTKLFNRGWFDDVCDGSVDCEVRDGTGPPQMAERAWVVTGAPAYAHQVGHLVTLYDVAETIAISKQRLPRPLRPSIVDHIFPVLRATNLQQWVTDFVFAHADPFHPEELLKEPGKSGALPLAAHRARRRTMFGRLRNPRTIHAHSGRKNPFLPHWYPVVGGQVVNDYGVALAHAFGAPQRTEMPRQIGLPFTLEQWRRFQQWENGTAVWDYPARLRPVPTKLEDITDGVDQVDALNRAHLRSIVGGSTTPGIEVGWKALETTSWGNAFRPATTLKPGDFTFSLSVPWPADFLACEQQPIPDINGVRNDWWPAARPISIWPQGTSPPADRVRWAESVTGGDVDWWKKRGFIVKNAAGTSFEEIEKP